MTTTRRTTARAGAHKTPKTPQAATPAPATSTPTSNSQKRPADGATAAPAPKRKQGTRAPKNAPKEKNKDNSAASPAVTSLSAEELELLLQLRAGKLKLPTAQAEAQASKDAASKKASDTLLDQEEQGLALDDEEQALSAALGPATSSIRQGMSVIITGSCANTTRKVAPQMPANEEDKEVGDEPQPQDGNDSSAEADQEEEEQTEDGVEGLGLELTGFSDNGIVSSLNKRATTPGTPSTPTPTGGSKVVLSCFTPRSERLATHSKAFVRERVALEGAFPLKKNEFVWKAISAAATHTGLEEVAQKSGENQNNLMKYAGYAITGLRGEVKTKARTQISGHYGIPGAHSTGELQGTVEWLLKSSNFTFGGVDAQSRTVDRNLPFGHQTIRDVIREQWFQGHGKSDARATDYMIRLGHIPPAVIVLATTVLEHSLQEWATGSLKSLDFSDESCSSLYVKNKSLWDAMNTECPTHLENLQYDLLEEILTQTNKVHLLLQGSAHHPDIQDLDYAAIEAAAQAKAALRRAKASAPPS